MLTWLPVQNVSPRTKPMIPRHVPCKYRPRHDSLGTGPLSRRERPAPLEASGSQVADHVKPWQRERCGYRHRFSGGRCNRCRVLPGFDLYTQNLHRFFTVFQHTWHPATQFEVVRFRKGPGLRPEEGVTMIYVGAACNQLWKFNVYRALPRSTMWRG